MKSITSLLHILFVATLATTFGAARDLADIVGVFMGLDEISKVGVVTLVAVLAFQIHEYSALILIRAKAIRDWWRAIMMPA